MAIGQDEFEFYNHFRNFLGFRVSKVVSMCDQIHAEYSGLFQDSTNIVGGKAHAFQQESREGGV